MAAQDADLGMRHATVRLERVGIYRTNHLEVHLANQLTLRAGCQVRVELTDTVDAQHTPALAGATLFGARLVLCYGPMMRGTQVVT